MHGDGFSNDFVEVVVSGVYTIVSRNPALGFPISNQRVMEFYAKLLFLINRLIGSAASALSLVGRFGS